MAANPYQAPEISRPPTEQEAPARRLVTLIPIADLFSACGAIAVVLVLSDDIAAYLADYWPRPGKCAGVLAGRSLTTTALSIGMACFGIARLLEWKHNVKSPGA